MKRIPALLLSVLALAFMLALTGCQSAGPVLNPDDADAVVQVNGMSCPQCANGIVLLMDGQEEVDQTRVDLGDGQVFIKFAPEKTLTAEQIADLVTRAGFTPGEVTYLDKESN